MSLRFIACALAAGLLCWGALAAPAGAAHSVDRAESKVPQLLLIHGGSFLYNDPDFEALTRGPALEAGFVPHYLHYPLGDLPGAVAAARRAARALGARYPGRVYAYGSSAGGTLAALLAGDGMVAAAVAKAPVSDLLDWQWPQTAIGPDYAARIGADSAMLRRLSPLRRPARKPLLVVQGRDDRIVPPAMNEAFAAKFQRVHLWAVPGGHWTERLRPRVISRSFGWLRRVGAALLP